MFSKLETGSHPRLPLPLASYFQLLESSYLPVNANMYHNFFHLSIRTASDFVQVITSLSEKGYFLTLAPISPLSVLKIVARTSKENLIVTPLLRISQQLTSNYGIKYSLSRHVRKPLVSVLYLILLKFVQWEH